GVAPVGREALTLDAATAALAALKTLAPMQTAVLMKGLFAAVSADGTIRVMEAELMRLVGAVLDCPLPPLLEQLDPATLRQLGTLVAIGLTWASRSVVWTIVGGMIALWRPQWWFG